MINPLISSQVPLCMFCWTVNLNLAWTYYFTGILIASSARPAIYLEIFDESTALFLRQNYKG